MTQALVFSVEWHSRLGGQHVVQPVVFAWIIGWVH